MENNYRYNVDVLWSYLDPNNHVRHSAYYDWGASSATKFITQLGLGTSVLLQFCIEPVIFKEEGLFKKEICLGDTVTVHSSFPNLLPEIGKWTLQHKIYKNETSLCAIITVHGSWINLKTRQLTALPTILVQNLMKKDITGLFEAGSVFS